MLHGASNSKLSIPQSKYHLKLNGEDPPKHLRKNASESHLSNRVNDVRGSYNDSRRNDSRIEKNDSLKKSKEFLSADKSEAGDTESFLS